jgi:hypothetical protein
MIIRSWDLWLQTCPARRVGNLDGGGPATPRREAAAIVDESHRRAICQIAGFDDAVPFNDPRLADGRRFQAVLGTPPSPGTCISLRVPAERSFSVEDRVASGSLTPVPRNSCPA